MSGPQLKSLEVPLLNRFLRDEVATGQLAEDLAAILEPGDLIALSGDLGAGKSALSRALLRTIAENSDLEVPSPTFTLVQTYDFERISVSHFDLYRLEEPDELKELGLLELLDTGAALVEWPELGGSLLPDGALWVQIQAVNSDPEARCVVFASDSDHWKERLHRTFAIREMILMAGLTNAHRHHLAGDASTRSYERIISDQGASVVMNWPAPQGAAGSKDALAYNKLVHRALDCRAFVAVGNELRRHGYAAPQVLTSDLDAGLLLLEDLGSEGVVSNGLPIPARYHAAVALLAKMHGENWPLTAPLPGGEEYHLPVYSRAALQAEAGLYLDWYVPYCGGAMAAEADRAEFHQFWAEAIESISGTQTGWVLRDFHSPNLLWRAEESGTSRVGLIDYQDAVFGSVAYDVASLLLDARVLVSEDLEQQLMETYVDIRRTQGSAFDRSSFEAAYAVMGAQRVTKIMGIFVRLASRDAKPAYLDHLPRMETYLDRVLTHPVLSDLKRWHDRHRS